MLNTVRAFILLLFMSPFLAYSQPETTENVTRTFLDVTRDFFAAHTGFDKRLKQVGLSGKLWKLFNYGGTDCPTNTLTTIKRLEFSERNFDTQQAYVAYLPFFNDRGGGWDFHVTLLYKGFILDAHDRNTATHFASGAMHAYTLPEYLNSEDPKLFDPTRKIVLMPAARYKWEMRFTNGRPPKIMRELGSYYTNQKVPHGIHVYRASELISILENDQLPKAPLICGYLF